MRNLAFGSAVAFAVITMLGGCGLVDEPAAVKPSSPTPSAPPDDVSLTFEPNEQELLTYGDRDGVDHPREVNVGRDYALYARCRSGSILVRVQEGVRGDYPWLPPCDGKTNRLVLTDGPKQIVVIATGPDGTRFTFAVVNIKAGAK